MHRLVEYVVLRYLLLFLRSLSYRASLRVGRVLGRIAYAVCGSLRRRTLANLRLAYGDALGAREVEAVAREAFDVLGRNVAEVAHLSRQPGRGLEIENVDALKAAYAQGKGVILISAHMGCFARMPVIPSMLGMKGACIMKRQKNRRLILWARGFLKRRLNLDVILKPDAPREVPVHLRSGSLVGFFADQHPISGGLPAVFFGQPVEAATGPAVCARRYRAPMVVLTLVSRLDGTHVCRVDPVDSKGSLQEVSQRWLSVIEARIREHPGQWMWMHRRFRTRFFAAPVPVAQRLVSSGSGI